MPSRHPRAATLIAAGLYRGLSSFRELEARIAALPEEVARGDAFEIFVEGYFWTMRVFQSVDLWLVGQVPLDVRRTLNLPADAKGIDGVFRTKAGQDVPYQVKFRIGRAMLGVAEVATFLGLTERASDRLLVSNATRCAPDVENRDGLRLLRGSDFDALGPEDLAAIAAWLDERPAERSRAAPRADQAKALAGIADALQTHPRATVVMPCGTGKTLVQLWAAEQLSPGTVLVLVPSLALLSQTLGEWSRHTSWGDRFEYLCVCSDPTVSAEQDAIAIRSTDVPFHVDTDPTVVRRFLNRPATGGVRVVFSTYQSAPIVARGLRGLAPFDLGIFDEAHKTTGVPGSTFAFGLEDARLRVRKRLFFTATPRHIDIRHRDREGDFRMVSMDDPTAYGPRAYTQTFADAVALGIICDYRVVVAVVDPGEVDDFAMRHGITLVRGDLQATRWVATQIAVSKAIRATAATRVITFHTRVKQAALFASDTPRGIGQYLDGFIVDHVNGAQRVADRKDILSGFRDARQRLVTNARCLTEGVDLPAVDMVVFSNPRRSRVDIVQAVGRAMRKPHDGSKTLGYVVVPVLLAPHEAADLAEACAGTDWEDVIDVLAALRDQDARLDEIIRAQQVAKGRGEVFNPRAFAERVQVLGPLVAVEVLERHVGALVLESLGVSWDERYGQLVAYNQQHGHCNVPTHLAENPTFGAWVNSQRLARRQNTLSSDRIARLDAIGFVWEPFDASWEEMYGALVAYQHAHGDCNVPRKYGENQRLSTWIHNQRRSRKRGTLSADRISQLDAIGFVWDTLDALWEEMYGALVAYKQRYGHCDVRKAYVDNPQLAGWVSHQRQLRKRGTLSADCISQLDAIGFVWDLRDALWEEMYAALVAYRRKHGDCDVPRGDLKNQRLGTWVLGQRQARKAGRLSKNHLVRLDAVGFSWRPHDSAWKEMYAALVAYKRKHGDCNVPTIHPKHQRLSEWVQNQRRSRKRGTLSADRISQLDAIGFVWDTLDALWEEMLAALVAYKRKHGDCNVPRDHAENPSLGTWVKKQRSAKSRGTLANERIARLDAIGFLWDPINTAWQEMFKALVAYRRQHGDCNVPRAYPANRKLARWVGAQREARGRGKNDRVARLDAIGFVWSSPKTKPRRR